MPAPQNEFPQVIEVDEREKSVLFTLGPKYPTSEWVTIATYKLVAVRRVRWVKEESHG
jgi:hypothetical protein